MFTREIGDWGVQYLRGSCRGGGALGVWGAESSNHITLCEMSSVLALHQACPSLVGQQQDTGRSLVSSVGHGEVLVC